METILDKQKKSLELINFLFTIVNKSSEHIDKKLHSQINAAKNDVPPKLAKSLENIQSSLTNFSAITGSMILMAEKKGECFYYQKNIQKIASSKKLITADTKELLCDSLKKYKSLMVEFYDHIKSLAEPLDYFANIYDQPSGSNRDFSMRNVSAAVKKYAEIFKNRYVESIMDDIEYINKNTETKTGSGQLEAETKTGSGQLEAETKTGSGQLETETKTGSSDEIEITEKVSFILGAQEEYSESAFSMNITGGNTTKWVSSSGVKDLLASHTAQIELIKKHISKSSHTPKSYYDTVIKKAFEILPYKTNLKALKSCSGEDLFNFFRESCNIDYPVKLQEKNLKKAMKRLTAYTETLPKKYMNEQERNKFMSETIFNDYGNESKKFNKLNSSLDSINHCVKKLEDIDSAILISRAIRKFSEINSIQDQDDLIKHVKEVKTISKKPNPNVRLNLLNGIFKNIAAAKKLMNKSNKNKYEFKFPAPTGDIVKDGCNILKSYLKLEMSMKDDMLELEKNLNKMASKMSEITDSINTLTDPTNTDTCVLHSALNMSAILAQDVIKNIASKRFPKISNETALNQLNSIESIGGIPSMNLYNNKLEIKDLKSLSKKFTRYTN